MNEVLLSALLGTLGGTLAAILSYLAARHTAKQEIQKLELANRQKQDETYFANARLHIETLYLPLNSNLTALDTAFELYEHRCKLGDEVKAREDFHDACEKCIEQITQLTSQGKDAYLTVRLEKRLRALIRFLRDSMEAQKVLTTNFWQEWQHQFKMEYKAAGSPEYSSRFKHLSHKEYDAEPIRKILAAPITTLQFKKQFRNDIDKLKTLIKEVTLGTMPSSILLIE